MKMRDVEEMMLRGSLARVATVDLSSAGASSLRDGVIPSLVKDVFWKLKWWNKEKKTPSDGSHAWEVEAQWELREAEGEEGEAGDDVAPGGVGGLGQGDGGQEGGEEEDQGGEEESALRWEAVAGAQKSGQHRAKGHRHLGQRLYVGPPLITVEPGNIKW